MDIGLFAQSLGVLLLILAGMYLWWSKRHGGLTPPAGKGALPFTTDMTQAVKTHAADVVVGREEEIRRAIQVLSRRRKNNVILVGAPGVGKTAIVEGLAKRIIQHDVPSILAEKRVLALSVAELIGGTKFRGEFEQRVKTLVNQLQAHDRQIILFIDEIHTLMQTKGAEGGVNVSDILKPALARGELQVIGATTEQEYERYIQPDESWERRFQRVVVDEPSEEESFQILQGIRDGYERYHHVAFSDDALRAAVRLSEQYIKGRNLPDKAIDVMDEAGAMVHVYADVPPHHTAAVLYEAAGSMQPQTSAQERKKQIQQLQRRLRTADTQEERDVLGRQIATLITEQQNDAVGEGKETRPVVTAAHIRSVIADWAGMDENTITI